MFVHEQQSMISTELNKSCVWFRRYIR